MGIISAMTDQSDAHLSRRRPRLTATVTDLGVARQRALLVGVVASADQRAAGDGSLAELELLTDTAGSDPVESILLKRDRFDAGTLIGKGQLADLVAESKALDIDVVVFDNELTPAQQRNLQQAFETDVVDRVALILDIFAQHAHTHEGMLQVELAQHRYRLPRLRGKGVELSRLGAGIGTRGPGETKLESDRRRILERVSKIERELKDVRRARATQSKARRKSGLPVVSLVGYTNAGKSTLFNQMTEADVLVEDRLFATLDSTVRQLELPDGYRALMSDTVGFVRRLPHEVVEAFRSTLEEAADADLLVHVVDASDADPDGQIDAVRTVLAEIEAGETPELIVFNKTDVTEPAVVERLVATHDGSVAASALTGEGIDGVRDAIAKDLEKATVTMRLLVPYERGDVVAALHDAGKVLDEVHGEEGTALTVRLPGAVADGFSQFAG
jgi:GTPase